MLPTTRRLPLSTQRSALLWARPLHLLSSGCPRARLSLLRTEDALGYPLVYRHHHGLCRIYGFWRVWFLGGGFGHRGFVELMPFGIVLLVVALSGINGSPQIVVTTLLTISPLVTLELMPGYLTT
jgi:hypothetical protein